MLIKVLLRIKKVTRVLNLLLPIPLFAGSYLDRISLINSFSFYSKIFISSYPEVSITCSLCSTLGAGVISVGVEDCLVTVPLVMNLRLYSHKENIKSKSS